MLFNLFGKKQAPPISAQESPQEQARTYNAPPLVLLGRMKWVVVENVNKVGIITNVEVNNMVVVDLVQEDGTTYGRTKTQIGNVRIARLEEIPACRRPANSAVAANLGYF